MFKKSIILLFLCLFGMQVFSQETCKQLQAVILYKKYVTQTKNARELTYNALNLTESQIEQKDALVSKNEVLYQEKLNLLIKEGYKYREMENSCTSDKELQNQKKVIKSIEKDLQNMLDCEDREFKKILNRQQKSKYSMIKKLERLDYKRELHQKDYYKSNPQLRKFGNP